MEGFGKDKFIACACFMAAYFIVYVAVGTFDNALDAALATNDIMRHDAEWSLSASYEAFVIVGLISIWVYDLGSWRGGFVAGSLAALAAGGFHVISHVTDWVLLAFFVGFVGGLILLIVSRKRSGACTLFSVEIALAVLQVAFIAQNM